MRILFNELFQPNTKMALLKILLTLLVLAFFAISFMTFDLASLNLDMPAGRLLRDNPFAIAIVAGILLIAFVADHLLNNKRAS